MLEITLIDQINSLSDESKLLVSIVSWRVENEPVAIQRIRYDYWKLMDFLCSHRIEAWRSEEWRNLSIAITHLEDSCIRAIKAYYSNTNG